VARELERELTRTQATAGADDARLIRDEVDRCKHILEQMATDSGASAGEAFTTVSVRELLQRSLEDLNESERVRVELETELAVKVPLTVLSRAVRGLVRNALQASTDIVSLRAEQRDDQLALEVRDRGTGMSAEVLASVGEPFFTTKPPGQGMGLGVFLARALCDRLGGTFELSSKLGEGTLVRVLLPHSPQPPGQ
jgi:two-component system sensor histidine kinase RegB